MKRQWERWFSASNAVRLSALMKKRPTSRNLATCIVIGVALDTINPPRTMTCTKMTTEAPDEPAT
jgi:hypothetical protein